MELFTKVDYPLAPFKLYLPVKVIKPLGELGERIQEQGVVPQRHPILFKDLTFLRRLTSERQMLLKENDYICTQAKKIMKKHNQLDNLRKNGEPRWSEEEIKIVSSSLLIDLELNEQQLSEIKNLGVPEEDPVTTLVSKRLSTGAFSANVVAWYPCEQELKRKKIKIMRCYSVTCLSLDLIKQYPMCGNMFFQNVYTEEPERIAYLKEQSITQDL